MPAVLSESPVVKRSPVPVRRTDYSDRSPGDPVKGEKSVWRGVILQALIDAGCMSTKRENQQWKAEALIWLRGNTPDFAEVCYHAGFEPEYARRMIRASLERNCSWRAMPGHGDPKKRPDRRPTGRKANQHR